MASVYTICMFSPDGDTVCHFKGRRFEVNAIVHTLKKGNPDSTLKIFTEEERQYYNVFVMGLKLIHALGAELPKFDQHIKEDALYWARACSSISC